MSPIAEGETAVAFVVAATARAAARRRRELQGFRGEEKKKDVEVEVVKLPSFGDDVVREGEKHNLPPTHRRPMAPLLGLFTSTNSYCRFCFFLFAFERKRGGEKVGVGR